MFTLNFAAVNCFNIWALLKPISLYKMLVCVCVHTERLCSMTTHYHLSHAVSKEVGSWCMEVGKCGNQKYVKYGKVNTLRKSCILWDFAIHVKMHLWFHSYNIIGYFTVLSFRPISLCDFTKLWRILIDYKLNWSEHIVDLHKRLSATTYALHVITPISDIKTTNAAYLGYFHSIMSSGVIFEVINH